MEEKFRKSIKEDSRNNTLNASEEIRASEEPIERSEEFNQEISYLKEVINKRYMGQLLSELMHKGAKISLETLVRKSIKKYSKITIARAKVKNFKTFKDLSLNQKITQIHAQVEIPVQRPIEDSFPSPLKDGGNNPDATFNPTLYSENVNIFEAEYDILCCNPFQNSGLENIGSKMNSDLFIREEPQEGLNAIPTVHSSDYFS